MESENNHFPSVCTLHMRMGIRIRIHECGARGPIVVLFVHMHLLVKLGLTVLGNIIMKLGFDHEFLEGNGTFGRVGNTVLRVLRTDVQINSTPQLRYIYGHQRCS